MSKPSFTMSVVTVKPGEVIPETFQHKLLTENRSAIGLVVQNNGVLDVEKFGDDEPLDTVEAELESLKLTLEGSKKFHRMFCFHSFPEEFDKDEIQPFILIKDSKDQPILVMALEGDFPGRGTAKMSEFYDVFHDYMQDKIGEMYTVLGNDPKKLRDYIEGKSFKKDIEQITGHRGVFAFMPAVGDPFAIGANQIGGEFSWGTASNAYGYTESATEAATPAKEEPTKKKSKYAADADEAPVIPKEPKPVVPVPQDTKPDVIKKAAEAAVEGHWEDIPGNVHGKRKKAYVRSKLGHLPPDWEKLTRLWIIHKTVVNSLADLDKTSAGHAVKDMKANAPVMKEEISQLPVISGPQQAAAVDFIKKFLDGNSNRITNPLELQKVESKIAVFSELCLGGNLDDVETWPTSVIFSFCKSHPEAAALAFIELRRDRMNRKQLKDLTGSLPTDGSTKEETTTTGTVSPPVHKKSKYA